MAKFNATFKLRTSFNNKRTGGLSFLYHYVIEEPTDELIAIADSKTTGIYNRDGETIATTFNPVGLEAVVTVSGKGNVSVINEQLMADYQAAEMLMPALRRSEMARIASFNKELIDEVLQVCEAQYNEWKQNSEESAPAKPTAKSKKATSKALKQLEQDLENL